MEGFNDFKKRFKHLIGKNPHLIKFTLSNIFTMRLIGNKTHGDMAEIAIAEFINQYMYDYKSIHVGKDLYRAKEHEEDIKIINEINNIEFPVSLKAYGDGPLQLSTDKNFKMYPKLQKYGHIINNREEILEIFLDESFSDFGNINILPLIYNEKENKCNIMVFDHNRAKISIHLVKYEKAEGRRKHPVYRFYDKRGGYICEVRYGDASANALQRGLWTHTRNAIEYFESLTKGWIDYSDNKVLVKLFSHALVSSSLGHEKALDIIKGDIEFQKQKSKLGEKNG